MIPKLLESFCNHRWFHSNVTEMFDVYLRKCITCTLWKKLYICETGKRLGYRFREHLRDVEKDDKNASKPVARHFNLSYNLAKHSKQHMSICGLFLHQGTTESRKNLKQKKVYVMFVVLGKFVLIFVDHSNFVCRTVLFSARSNVSQLQQRRNKSGIQLLAVHSKHDFVRRW